MHVSWHEARGYCAWVGSRLRHGYYISLSDRRYA
ncbi:hypothetical protein [Sinorhizobium meliloti]